MDLEQHSVLLSGQEANKWLLPHVLSKDVSKVPFGVCPSGKYLGQSLLCFSQIFITSLVFLWQQNNAEAGIML